MGHDTTQSARKRKPDRAKITIKGSWTAIPNKLLTDIHLSRDARLLGALLLLYAGNAGRAFPSQEHLAETLGCTRRSIQRWLEELQQAGWVEWRQTLRNNEYTIKDPDESDTLSSDSSLNTALTGATPVSPHVIPVSHSDATQGSPSVTPESHSDATQGSGHATQESYQATPVSHSTLLYKDSLDLDSSSSDSTPTHHPDDDDDDVVAYLRDQGVTAAAEFATLDLPAVRARVEQIQRDPNWQPGAIVVSLRNNPPRAGARTRTRVAGPIDVDRYTNGAYGDLFRRGDDVSDLEPVDERSKRATGG